MGLAMTPYLAEKDDLAIESVIQALFDGGYYTKIKLSFFSSNKIIERQYIVEDVDVPDWFLSIPFFEKISSKRVLTSGWVQLAQIEIEAHPAYAYENLWHTLKQLLINFMLILIVFMFAMGFTLAKILRPIALMRNQAQKLSKNEFDRPLNLPNTKDLRELVKTFNHMSNNLQQQFIEQARNAEQLRNRAYKDNVTGLFNRDYFSNQVDSWLLESSVGGIGILFSQKIKDIYDQNGYKEGDRAVCELTEMLTHTLEDEDENAILARFSQFEFSLLIPGISEKDFAKCGERLAILANEFRSESPSSTSENANMGMVYCENTSTRGEIFAQIDNALNQAMQQSDLSYYLIKHSEGDNYFGKQQWQTLVQEAINTDSFSFKYQAATDKNAKQIHNELYSGFEKDGQFYSAIKFLWAIEKQEIGIVFDRFVIKHAIDELKSDRRIGPIAVNLNIASITNASFIHWLEAQLEQNQDLAEYLIFEIHELAIVRHKDEVKLLCEKISKYKFKYGIDSYGRHFNSLDYLNDINPDYVKIDYVYTNHLEDQAQHDILSSICRTAHNLNITTIATRVETQEQLDALSKLYVDGFQGFIFAGKN